MGTNERYVALFDLVKLLCDDDPLRLRLSETPQEITKFLDVHPGRAEMTAAMLAILAAMKGIDPNCHEKVSIVRKADATMKLM